VNGREADITDRQVTPAESALLHDLRARFSTWTIVSGGGYSLAVRSGEQAYDGPRSLIRRALSAATLPELARMLELQARIDQCSDAELEEIWRDGREDLSVSLYPVARDPAEDRPAPRGKLL